MTTNDLEYYKNLVAEAGAGIERNYSNFEGRSEGTLLSNSTARYRKTICKKKSQLTHQTSVFSYFKKFP